MELEACSISVSCVHPGVINTPIVQDNTRSKIPQAQLQRLQQHYIDEGVHPRVVAEDILEGVITGAGTILSGKDVGKIALLKRLLPRKTYRKVLIGASRKIGYLPEQ
jgi:short-subunit dehydrogenase